MPAEIVQLASLTELGLGGNQLTSLPPEIVQLANLTSLGLYSNQLTSLPPEIGQLANLTSLSLALNQLTSLPPEIVQLANLRSLLLGGTQLTSLPSEIGQLANLMMLSLEHNQLTSLPPEIVQLASLTELDLGGNQLTSLPSEIGQLANLTSLRLERNQLTSLPAEIGQLANLTELRLDDNPLTSPPAETVAQGTPAVLAYLRELAKGRQLGKEETKRYEAKLLILGDGNEGKTCVSRALRGKDFRKQETTLGVDVRPWSFPHPDDPRGEAKRITLNIWDFEGQEINHQSHQFFLTRRSLYLVVFKGREQVRIDRLEYWLDTIRARAPGSRVVLVATECEDRTPYVPLDRLRRDYPELLRDDDCLFAVGCATSKNIDALSTHLRRLAADLDVMGTPWPASYTAAEATVREKADRKGDNRAHVTRQDLYDVFASKEIESGSFDHVANLMAALGLITHFPDCVDLEDFVVLKPQWLTKAISRVMEDDELERDRGEITHQRLYAIWREQYPGLANVFHSCMKEFELAYDMEDEEGCLVPLRFGFERPTIPWSEIPGAKVRRIEYRFHVTPPAGIIGRFIVKTHHMIVKTAEHPKGVYWHDGVFLATGQGPNRSEALATFDEEHRVLRLEVRAAFPQNMVEQLGAFAGAVFGFFEGLQPERHYGCVIGEEEQEEQCPGVHPEQRISFALAKRRATIDCERGYHEVDPLYLVSGISSFGESKALEERLRKMLRAEMDKRPEWAERFGRDVGSVLVRVDQIAAIAEEFKDAAQEIPAAVGQQIELAQHDMLGLLNEMLDNRDFNAAPSIVSIVPVDGSRFNPRDWFEKRYVVTPYCESADDVHPCEGVCEPFSMPRAWWEKAAPKLALGVRLLSAGVQIACAGLPMAVNAALYAQMKNEADFMKELAKHLALEGGAVSDISEEGAEYVRGRGAKPGVLDLRQTAGDDPNRIARMQLAELLEAIAPDNYKAKQWGPLRRVPVGDNTYRWMCDDHARRIGK